MKRLTISLCLLAMVSGPNGPAELAQEGNERSEILVSDRKTECGYGGFHSIQNAVNAARRGDTIHVCKGRCPEQVVVRKSVTLAGDDGGVLVPMRMVRNASSLSTGESLAAAIFVSDAEGVDVTGFSVDASNNGLVGCAPRLIGILYQNASGQVASNTVRHVKL